MSVLPGPPPALLAASHPAVAGLVQRAGRVRDRLDHPQLRDARRILRAFRGGAPDVVLLGESVLSFVGPRDRDRRTLARMVADDLGSASLLAVHGGGYHAELLTAYLDLIAATHRRPQAVVVPLWVRGRFRPWIEHPRFGHVEALRRLRALDPTAPPWRVRGSLRRAGADAFAVLDRLPHPTLLGDLAVGDYTGPLKGGRLDADERLRLLYAYHHGASLAAGDPGLAAVTCMGRALRALGCEFFAYETPVSVSTGARALGPAFRPLVEANFAAVRDAFRAGAGAGADVLLTGTAFAEEEFIDPSDGSEHLNERGRRRLSDLLVTELAARAQ